MVSTKQKTYQTKGGWYSETDLTLSQKIAHQFFLLVGRIPVYFCAALFIILWLGIWT